MVSELKEDLHNLLNSITISIQNSKASSELENIRVNSLGKKGSITLYLRNLRDYDLETKKEILSRLLEESQTIICRETNAADSQDFLYGEDGMPA